MLAGRALLHDPGPHGRFEGGHGVAGRRPARRGQHVGPERGPGDGGQPDEVPGRVRQPAEPGRHHLAHALRADQGGGRRGAAPDAPGGCGAGLDQLAPQLAEQEGVAAGLAHQLVDRRVRVVQPLAAAGQLGEAAHLVPVEAAEHQPGHAGLPPQVGERGLEVVPDLGGGRAERGDDAQPLQPGAADQVVEQLERGTPGPVEVVEHEQHGLLGRQGGERVDHGAEQPVPLGPGIVGTLPRRVGRDGGCGGQPGHEPRQLLPAVTDQPLPAVGVEPGDEQVERHGERLVGDGRLLAALAVEDGGTSLVDPPAQLRDEPGLPGPGIAPDEHDPARAAGRPLPGLDERLPRRGPPDEGELGLQSEHRGQRQAGRRGPVGGPGQLDAVHDPRPPGVEGPDGHPGQPGAPVGRAERGERGDGGGGDDVPVPVPPPQPGAVGEGHGHVAGSPGPPVAGGTDLNRGALARAAGAAGSGVGA